MIDLKQLRENQEEYSKGFAKKQVKVDVDKVLKIDEEYRAILQKVEEYRSEKNQVSKMIPTLKDDERQSKIVEMKALGEKLDQAEDEMDKLSAELKGLTDGIPNPPHDSVPEGKSDEENQPIKTVGEIPKFSFKPKDHLELGTLLDVIDMETATKTSGAR
ncbi:MAG: serine--tRNA ligase, partial [Candidatus Heimdallarchaeota archaeon]|nr:serine--tRNA ligase [Candidatus Heimdallarchaeota archaeon]